MSLITIITHQFNPVTQKFVQLLYIMAKTILMVNSHFRQPSEEHDKTLHSTHCMMPRTVVCGAVVMVLDMVVVVQIMIRVRPNVGYWRRSGVVARAAARPLSVGVAVADAAAAAAAVAEVGCGADCAGRPRQRSVERGRQQLCGVCRPHRHDRRAATDAEESQVPRWRGHDLILNRAVPIHTYEVTSSNFFKSLSFSLQTSSWSRRSMSLTENRSWFSFLRSWLSLM